MDVPFKKKYNSDAQEVSLGIKLTSTHTWSLGENLILFYIFVHTECGRFNNLNYDKHQSRPLLAMSVNRIVYFHLRAQRIFPLLQWRCVNLSG